MGSLSGVRLSAAKFTSGLINRTLSVPAIGRAFAGVKDRCLYAPVARLDQTEWGHNTMDAAGRTFQFFNDEYPIGLTRIKAQLATSLPGSDYHKEALHTLLKSPECSAQDVAFGDLLNRHRVNPGLASLLSGSPVDPQRTYQLVESLLMSRHTQTSPADIDMISIIREDIRSLSDHSFWLDSELTCRNIFGEWGDQYLETIAANEASQLPSLAPGQQVMPLDQPPASSSPPSAALKQIMAHIRKMPDEEIATMIFPPTLINEIQAFRGDLQRVGLTPERLMGYCLASCSHMAKLGLQLLRRQFPHMEWLQGCFPIHASIIGRRDKDIFIYDSALGQMTDVYRFDNIYERVGMGQTYVLKDFAAAYHTDMQAVAHHEEPTAVAEFFKNHPLRDYYFYQPVNENGYASVFTLNVGDIYRVFYKATGDEAYLIKALQHFRQAKEIHPDLAEPNSAIAQIHRELFQHTKRPQRIEMAIEAAQTAVKLNPYDPSAYFQLGQAYLEKARQFNDPAPIQEAMQVLYTAARLHPDYIDRVTRLWDERQKTSEMDLLPTFRS